jgi:hypothetical protein
MLHNLIDAGEIDPHSVFSGARTSVMGVKLQINNAEDYERYGLTIEDFKKFCAGLLITTIETAPISPQNGEHAALTSDLPPTSDSDEKLAALFDPVPVAALEKMFPAVGAWERWAERAARNGLSVARKGRGTFNPYRAAAWFITKNITGWDWARCRRTLQNNLPARSQDEAYLLIPDDPN